eukprot:7286637-Prymnesium_polylepis.1
MGACPRPRVDGDARRAAGRLVVVEAPRRRLASDGLLHAGAARCGAPTTAVAAAPSSAAPARD